MFINGTEVIQSRKDGQLCITVNDRDFLINPNTISQAWILHNSNRYDLIKFTNGWKKDIYQYLLSNSQPNIPLIALLLVTK
jgi:hypothetical protein